MNITLRILNYFNFKTKYENKKHILKKHLKVIIFKFIIQTEILKKLHIIEVVGGVTWLLTGWIGPGDLVLATQERLVSHSTFSA